MMVQGGFPLGAGEVKGLLGEMEGRGVAVGVGGDVWGVAK